MICPTLLTLIAALSLTTATPVKRTDAYLLHAKNSPDNCLGTTGDLYNGISLQNVPCSEAETNPRFKGKWEIVRGNNENGIRLSGTDYCLDATLPLTDTGDITLWTCLPGTAQQTVACIDDDHIALTDQNSCLDFNAGGCGQFTCAPGRRACGTGPDALAGGQEWTVV
ncbi:hypothetical protein FFLO_05418 [Filobasidium floriforme]|uniref:Ricin B lectin domain-containing protein n=1 Tax=Filobasidium floriforme TaxID=5210 RepID=A0A8K0JHD9_9TREE|nr:hypothetical protein FFLO_05418 [Filobasidium floriforme]